MRLARRRFPGQGGRPGSQGCELLSSALICQLFAAGASDSCRAVRDLPPTCLCSSTARHSTPAELSVEAEAGGNQIFFLSGTVAGVLSLDLVGIGKILESWSLAGKGSWRIQDCLSLSSCTRSLEKCCLGLACYEVDDHGDHGEQAFVQFSVHAYVEDKAHKESSLFLALCYIRDDLAQGPGVDFLR